MGATGNLNKYQHIGSAELEQLEGSNCWRNSALRSTQHFKSVTVIMNLAKKNCT